MFRNHGRSDNFPWRSSCLCSPRKAAAAMTFTVAWTMVWLDEWEYPVYFEDE